MLFNSISEGFQRFVRRPAEPMEKLQPETPFWSVGDVHGCHELLERILAQIDNAPIVFVGDLIDRGPDSRRVLERVFELCMTKEYLTLMGNHEKMLLDFLDAPETLGRAWLRYGGLQTLESFGIPLGGSAPSDAACREARDSLVEKMGAPMIKWLSDLPSIWSNGNVHVVHAGADPLRPMSMQDLQHLTWGHRDFQRVKRTDGQWIVHGHVIVPKPIQASGRIAIDTGAYASGILTAAYITPDKVDFVSTSA